MKYYVIISNKKSNFFEILTKTNDYSEAIEIKRKYTAELYRFGYRVEIWEQKEMFVRIEEAGK